MKIEFFLDYPTILANQARPVHFAIQFAADKVGTTRPKPAAFCAVLDRSGSMHRSKITVNAADCKFKIGDVFKAPANYSKR